jgi:hypothetical protein
MDTTWSNAEARVVAARIRANVEDVDAGRVTWAEFSMRNIAAWDSVIRGELCVIGSPCERRVSAIRAALEVAT